jgi:hypothetical protein
LLALIAQLSGDDAMSQKHAQRAIKLADGADAPGPALAGRFVMANALASMGRWAEAEEAYRQVLERAEHMGAAYLAMGHAGLARAALARDDPSGAATHIEPVVRTLQDDPLLYQSPSTMVVYLITYRTLQALNDERASDLLRTAYTIVQDVAAKIEDDELRRSYLENVPAHRGIVAAYEKAHAVE